MTSKLFAPSVLFAVILAGITPTISNAQSSTHYGSQVAIPTTTNGNTAFQAVAVDTTGNVYIVDTGNNVVYKQTLSGGSYTQTTILNQTNNGLKLPVAIAVDGSGNLYISDSFNERLLKETVGIGGIYTQSVIAQNSGGNFVNPDGVAVDANGNVYVSAQTYVSSAYVSEVYKFTPGTGGTYTQSTVVGTGLNSASGVAVDSSGNVYIADGGNTRVLKETLSGGTYTQSVVVDDSAFNWLDGATGLAVDSNGDVFVTNTNTSGYDANTVVEAVLSGGSYHMRLVGAGFSQPFGVAVDTSGNVYVTANPFSSVVKISYPSTNFGSVNVGATSAVMTLPFTTASFNGSLSGLTLSMGASGEFTNTGTGTCDTNGSHLYIVGSTCTVNVTFTPKFAGIRNGVVELVNSSNVMVAEQYLTGIGLGPQAAFAPGTQTTIGTGLNSPTAVAVDGKGNIYIADSGATTIYLETPSGSTYTQSQPGINLSGLGQLAGLAVDAADNLYYSYALSSQYYVNQSEPIASIGYQGNPVAEPQEGSTLATPKGVAVDGGGNVYIADTGNNRVVEELYSSGSTYNQPIVWQIVVASGLSGPQAIATDSAGDVFIADTGNNRILKEAPTGVPGVFTQSVIVNSGLNAPAGIALDDIGNIYISDTGNKRVLKETLSGSSYTQGVVLSTGLGSPQGLALDSSGNIYIADSTNKVVVKLALGSTSSLTFASTPVGSTSSDSPQIITLENLGNAPLIFPIPGAGTDPSISSNFSLNSTSGSACPSLTTSASTAGLLAANSSCTLTISFTPTSVGGTSGSLVETDNSLNVAASTQTISLNGTGSAAPIASLPMSLSFPTTTVGTTSTALTATLTNTGSAAMTITSITITGTNPSDFAITTGSNACGSTLAIAASCSIYVTFTPATSTSFSAQIAVTDNAGGSPQTVALSGAAAPATIVPSSPLVFNPVAVGVAAGSAQTLTVTFTLNGFAPGFSPTAKLHYGLSFTAGAVNCTGGSSPETCTVAVTFQPQYPGARKDALLLMNGTTVMSTVLLGGIGQSPFALVQPGVVTNPILSGPNYLYQSAVGEDGTVYVTGDNSNSVYSVTKAGVVTLLPITGLSSPHGIAVDGAGTLYIAQNTYSKQIITYTAAGVQGAITVVPPAPYVPCSNSNGGALEYLYAVAVDQSGNLFTLELLCNQIFKLSPSGTYTTTTMNPVMTQPSTMTVDSADNVFVGGYAINELTALGVQSQINTIGAGDGLGVDAADTLYATRYTGTTGVAELPASGYGTYEAALDLGSSPLGTSVGSDGTLYVGNYTNLDKVDRSQGIIAFGQISAAATQNVSIYNGGNQPLTITNIAISGPGFTFLPGTTNPCALNVAMAPGTLCQVAVTLTPPHAGTFSGSLTFTSNSLNNVSSTQSVALSGAEYGVYVTPSPTSLTFPNQIVSTTSTAQTITLTNNGELYTASIGTPSSGSSSFSVGLGTCTSGLAVGASCQLSVTFTPGGPTAYNNILVTVPYSSSGGGTAPPPVTFTLSGTGTPAPTPGAALSPNPLAFPSTLVGIAGTTLPLTLSNPGTAALTITGISVTGTNASSFGQSNNCGASLAAGASCTITVTFTPASTGSLSASISVADNATGSPHTAALAGTGIKFVSNVGTALSAQPVTITIANTGTLNSIQVLTQGAAGLDFTSTTGGTCATTTAYTVGQSCTVNVIFTPASAGSRRGAILLTDASNNVLGTTFLSGTGNGPQIVFAPGVQTTLPGPTYASSYSAPLGIAVDASGNVFVADTLNGFIDKLTFSGSSLSAPVRLPAIGLNQPAGIAIDGSGNIWIADTQNSRVVELPWNGSSYGTQVVLAATIAGPEAVAVDGFGNVFISDTLNKRIVEIPWTGSSYGAQTILLSTGLAAPHGLTVDATGNLFITNSGSSTVVELPWTGTAFGSPVTLTTTGLFYPSGIAVDGGGDLYIADTDHGRIVELPWSGSAFGTQVAVPFTLSGTSITSAIAVDGSGNIYITDSGNNNVLKLTVSNPPSLAFAATNIGSTSTDSPKTVVATNIGNASLTFSSGTNPNYPANFPVNSLDANLCGNASPLLRGASCDVSVNFKPTTSGGLSGNVVLTDNNLNGTNVTQSVGVSGTGNASATPQAVLSPNPLAFPSTLVGTAATALPMTLSNPGTAALTITSISVTGTNASSFGQSNNCGASLAAGASCTITVTFTPASTGSLSASVSVVDNATGSPHTAALTGTGTAPQSSLTLSTLTYSGTLVGTSASTQTTTLSNPGTAPLTITGISIAGTNASSFGQINTCGASLAAGATCTITVTFTPASAGSLSASLSIADNATGSPQTVSLSGTGTAPQAILSPNPLAFPNTLVGTPATALPMTLSNPGTAPLTITSISVTGTNASSFGQSNNCGASLAAGATCTITVTFTPASAAALTAAISVTDSATGSPHTAALTGTGVAPLIPQAVLSPNPLTFPSTTINTPATPLPMTLSNPGNTALTITSITVTGTNASNFGQTNTCGASLAAGATCTITVTFTPTSAASFSGAISVVDNAAGSPQSAVITGTGSAGTYVVNSSTPSNTVQPGGVAQYNLTIAPLGGSFNNLVTLTATGLPAGATYSFLPPAVTPGSAGAPSVLSIQTSTGLARMALPESPRQRSLPLLALLAGLPLLGIAGNLRRLRKSGQRWILLGLAALTILPMLALSGCGGGYFGPAPQTYTVTVTGTSGALQQSTTISLTVQ